MLKEIKTAEGISLSTNVILEGKVHVFNDSVKRQSFVLRYKNQILLYSECIKGRKVSSEITFITEGLINVKGINLHRVNNCIKDVQPFNWNAFEQLQEELSKNFKRLDYEVYNQRI